MVDTKRIASKLVPLIEKNLVERLGKEIPNIINIIMEDYDLMLNDVDTNLESQSRPEFYMDKFRSLLENMDTDKWIVVVPGSRPKIIFNIPSANNLDLRDLPVLGLLFEGVVGRYVTATERQFKDAGLKPGSRIPLDRNVRPDNRVYLIRVSDPIKQKLEKALKLRDGLPEYAFSNTPGINIFENANKYYDSNIDRWIDEATKKANDELERVV